MEVSIMTPPRGPKLPVLLRVSVGLTLFNTWVLFEETVVDRLGWWRYMPCYRVGRFCEWDVAAIVVIALVVAAGLSTTRSVGDRVRRFCGNLGCHLCRA
jgi:hypothetical protein